MLTRQDLIALHRTHRQERVLSIYLDAEEHDPAKRRAWRRTLDHIVDTEANRVPESERGSFERALVHLRAELRRYDAFLPNIGWVGFATEDRLLHAETIGVPMPDMARWENGLRVAPYVRALRQTVPVITLLVDRRQARRFLRRNGSFQELEPVKADTFFGDLSDVNMSKRATTHSGVRGETETDAAHRYEEVGAERLLKYLSDYVANDMGSDGILVIGGPTEIAHALLQRLPKSLDGRAIEEPSMSFWMTDAELKRASETAAASVIAGLQAELLDEIMDHAGAGGRGSLGREATDRALSDRRVEVLLLTPAIGESDPEYADRCVGAAFEQDADVEELQGEAAVRLDGVGGIGARLRY